MARSKNKSRESSVGGGSNERGRADSGRPTTDLPPVAAAVTPEALGLRERKKAKLRQDIVKTSQRLFLNAATKTPASTTS